MNWTKWALDAGERLIKTFLQAFLAQITASGLGLIEILEDTTTLQRAGVAGLAAVYSLIFSWASSFANGSGTSPASLVSTQ